MHCGKNTEHTIVTAGVPQLTRTRELKLPPLEPELGVGMRLKSNTKNERHLSLASLKSLDPFRGHGSHRFRCGLESQQRQQPRPARPKCFCDPGRKARRAFHLRRRST